MRILNTTKPSDNQKRVIALILAAETPAAAADKISSSQNMIAARDMLARLGAIEFTNREAALTQTGISLAIEQNLCDDNEELTDEGRSLIQDESEPSSGGSDSDPSPPMDDLGAGMEGFSPLFKNIVCG